jgi:hypothetical protein
MIDLCSVVFREELPVLKVQAQSISTYARNIGIRNIYVVVNDDETLSQDIDPAWWGDMGHQVLVVPRSAFSAPWAEDGWLTQQLWKMLMASMSYNTWTMIMDAKVVLTKPLDLQLLFDDQGRARTGFLDIYPVFEPSQRIAENLFGIELDQQIGPGGVPFLFHNDTVRFMIAEVMLRTKQNFPHWFQAQGRLTEFILYSAFVKSISGSLDKIYSPEPSIRHVNLCHSEVSRTDQKLIEMRDPGTTSVSVHRSAWSQMTQEQKHSYRSLLIDHGLLDAIDL